MPNESLKRTAQIHIEVELDARKHPASLRWSASDYADGQTQSARAFALHLWDSEKKEALSMGLWEDAMTVAEMHDFVFQSVIQLADTYARATRREDIAGRLRHAALQHWEAESTSGANAK
jgi:gliding motility-associated protein GldC